MSTKQKEEAGGMDPCDDEALWRLLGQARGTEISPYFSRRVLREAALSEEKGRVSVGVGGRLAGLLRMLRRPRAAVWPGAVVVAVFWLTVVATTPSSHTSGRAGVRSPEVRPFDGEQAALDDSIETVDVPAVPTAAEEVATQDVDVIADLDNMITREENRLWTEDTARF